MENESNTLRKGIACIIASAFGFAVMGLCVGAADRFGDPISSFQKSFFRNIVAFFIAGFLFLKSDFRSINVPKAGIPILILRSVCGCLGIFCNFYALSRIPIGDGQALNKTSPFFAVLGSWIFLKERLSFRQAVCITGAFIGALFIVKPVGAFGEFYPAFCGLLGGVGAGVAYTCVHKLGRIGMDAKFIVLFFSAFSCLASVPFMVADFDPMTWQQVLVLCGAGIGAAAGQFGITNAYRFAEPRKIAVYDYSNIIFTCILGYLFLDQIPDLFSWIGMAIIVLMAFVINRRT